MLTPQSTGIDVMALVREFEGALRYWFNRSAFADDSRFNLLKDLPGCAADSSAEQFSKALQKGDIAEVGKTVVGAFSKFKVGAFRAAEKKGLSQKGKAQKVEDQVTRKLVDFTVDELLTIANALPIHIERCAHDDLESDRLNFAKKYKILRAYALRYLAAKLTGGKDVDSDGAKEALEHLKTIVKDSLMEDLAHFPNPVDKEHVMFVNYSLVAEALLEDSLDGMTDEQKQSIYYFVTSRLPNYYPLDAKKSLSAQFKLYTRFYESNLLDKQHESMGVLASHLRKYCPDRVDCLFADDKHHYAENLQELEQIEASGFLPQEKKTKLKLMQALCYYQTAEPVELQGFLNYFDDVDFTVCTVDAKTMQDFQRSDASFDAVKLGYSAAVLQRLLQSVESYRSEEQASDQYNLICKFISDCAGLLLEKAKAACSDIPVEVTEGASFEDTPKDLFDMHLKPLEEIKERLETLPQKNAIFGEAYQQSLKSFEEQRQNYYQMWLQYFSQHKDQEVEEADIRTLIKDMPGNVLYSCAKQRADFAKVIIMSSAFNKLSNTHKQTIVVSCGLSDKSVALRVLSAKPYLDVLSLAQKKALGDFILREIDRNDVFAQEVVMTDLILSNVADDEQREGVLRRAIDLSNRNHAFAVFIFNSAKYREYLSEEQLSIIIGFVIVEAGEGLDFVKAVMDRGINDNRLLEEHELALVVKAIQTDHDWHLELVQKVSKLQKHDAQVCIKKMLSSNEAFLIGFMDSEASSDEIYSSLRSHFSREESFAMIKDIVDSRKTITNKLAESFILYGLGCGTALTDCVPYLKRCSGIWLFEWAKKDFAYAEFLFNDVDLMEKFKGQMLEVVKHYDKINGNQAALLRFKWLLASEQDIAKRKAEERAQIKQQHTRRRAKRGADEHHPDSSDEEGSVHSDAEGDDAIVKVRRRRRGRSALITQQPRIPDYIETKFLKDVGDEQLMFIAQQNFSYAKEMINREALLRRFGIEQLRSMLASYQSTVSADEHGSLKAKIDAYEATLKKQASYDEMVQTFHKLKENIELINIALSKKNHAVAEFNDLREKYDNGYSSCSKWEETYKAQCLSWVKAFRPVDEGYTLLPDQVNFKDFVRDNPSIESERVNPFSTFAIDPERMTAEQLETKNAQMQSFIDGQKDVLEDKTVDAVETFLKQHQVKDTITTLDNNLSVYQDRINQDIVAGQAFLDKQRNEKIALERRIEEDKKVLQANAERLLDEKGLSIGDQVFQFSADEPISQKISAQNKEWAEGLPAKCPRIGRFNRMRFKLGFGRGSFEKIMKQRIHYWQQLICHEYSTKMNVSSVGVLSETIKSQGEELANIVNAEEAYLRKNGLMKRFVKNGYGSLSCLDDSLEKKIGVLRQWFYSIDALSLREKGVVKLIDSLALDEKKTKIMWQSLKDGYSKLSAIQGLRDSFWLGKHDLSKTQLNEKNNPEIEYQNFMAAVIASSVLIQQKLAEISKREDVKEEKDETLSSALVLKTTGAFLQALTQNRVDEIIGVRRHNPVAAAAH